MYMECEGDIMKKQYFKPELLFEDFTLAEAISACGVIAGPTNGDDCSWDGFVPGLPMFNSQVNLDCVLDYEDYEGSSQLDVFGS